MSKYDYLIALAYVSGMALVAKVIIELFSYTPTH